MVLWYSGNHLPTDVIFYIYLPSDVIFYKYLPIDVIFYKYLPTLYSQLYFVVFTYNRVVRCCNFINCLYYLYKVTDIFIPRVLTGVQAKDFFPILHVVIIPFPFFCLFWVSRSIHIKKHNKKTLLWIFVQN